MKKILWVFAIVTNVEKHIIVEVAMMQTLKALYFHLKWMPSLDLISRNQGIRGSATPWTGKPVRPDMVFDHSNSLIVVVDADEDDGHSSRGCDISKYGAPWEYHRDFNAEMAKMQTCSQALFNQYDKNVLFIRCNSDNTSIRLGDEGLSERAEMVNQKITSVIASSDAWPSNSFRLALIDMPSSRKQSGTPIPDSDDVFICWNDIQQTTNPTPKDELQLITAVYLVISEPSIN